MLLLADTNLMALKGLFVKLAVAQPAVGFFSSSGGRLNSDWSVFFEFDRMRH